MPYPRSFLRQTLLWTLPGGEVASTSCAWDNNGGGIIGTPTAEADALEAKAAALWTAIKWMYSGQTSFVGSRIAVISVAGLTVETLERSSAPSAGTDDGNNLPTEVAEVVSLRTATYSRSGRGRMYFPAFSTDMCSTAGRLAGTSAPSLAEASAEYLGSFDGGPAEYFSVVASKTQFQLRPIVECNVGDVYDAQRRRRDALIEVRSTEPVS